MKMTKKRPLILVPHGAQKRLAESLGVTSETVRRALKYITDSEEAVRIRKEAVTNFGGKEVEVGIL